MEIGLDPRAGARTIKDSPLYPAARDQLYRTLSPKQTTPSPMPSIPQPGPSSPRKKYAKPFPSSNLNGTKARASLSQDIIEISDDDEPGIRPLVVFAWVKVSFHHFILFQD